MPAFYDWAFAHDGANGRLNEAHPVADGVKSIAEHPIPSFPNVDVIMTHGPAKGILFECPGGSAGCGNLLQALVRARLRMQCFGHIYESQGTEVINWGSQEGEVPGATNRGQENLQEQRHICNAYPDQVRLLLLHG